MENAGEIHEDPKPKDHNAVMNTDSLNIKLQNGNESGTLMTPKSSLLIPPTDTPPRTKYYYWKNFAGLSFGMLCLFTAYDSLFFLQSSLHSKGGLGSTALAVDYSTQVLVSLFLPALLMKKIGFKWTLVFALLSIILYIAMNMKASFETLIPASIFLAIGFSNVWPTSDMLVCDLAHGYAGLTNSDPAAVRKRLLGIFFMVVESAKIWGSLLSSLILQQDAEKSAISDEQISICGANYCHQKLGVVQSSLLMSNYTNGTSLNNSRISFPVEETHGGATQSQIVTLCSVAIGICGVSLFLVVLLVDSRKSTKDTSKLLTHALSTAKLFTNVNLLLILILSVCYGLIQSFYASDYTKSFVTCSLGIQNVGFVVMSYGVVLVLCCLIMGFISHFITRQFWIILYVSLYLIDLVAMLLWTPDPKLVVVFYVMACVFAVCGSMRMVVFTSLYAELFPSQLEEAFSIHRLLSCLGFAIGFTWSPHLCMRSKIYGTIALHVLGTIGYLVLELKLRLESKNVRKNSKAN